MIFISETLLSTFIPLVLLLFVNLAVIFRRIGKLEVPAWTAFMAAALIITFIQPNGYERAIEVIVQEIDVLIFLFGMFVLVTALEISGVLEELSKFILSQSKSPRRLLLWTHLGLGLAASILINDTIAIIGPIVLISFSRQMKQDSKPYVLAVAFGLTFGSALLPTGNPQNFILAKAGNINYLEFLIWALFPTFFAIAGSFFTLKFFFKSEFSDIPFVELPIITEKHEYQQLAKPAKISFLLLLVGLVLSPFLQISITIVILVFSCVFLFFVNERDVILEKINWGVMFFFAGMFIVLDSVTNSEIFIEIVPPIINSLEFNLLGFIILLILLFILCQIFSNVPVAIMVAMIIPGTNLDHTLIWITIALTTTFAGATTVLGAASNIIVIETSSKRGLKISWVEFVKIGIIVSGISFIGLIIYGACYFFLFS